MGGKSRGGWKHGPKRVLESKAKKRKPASRGSSPAPLIPEPIRLEGSATDLNLNIKALARLAENVWRLERRAERSVESASWAQPVIERLNDDLKELGVEIIDRVGSTYSDGETMEKVHSDAPADWSGGLLVTEVISPTIRIAGQVVEPGKVVVGPDVRVAKED